MHGCAICAGKVRCVKYVPLRVIYESECTARFVSNNSHISNALRTHNVQTQNLITDLCAAKKKAIHVSV